MLARRASGLTIEAHLKGVTIEISDREDLARDRKPEACSEGKSSKTLAGIAHAAGTEILRTHGSFRASRLSE
jgi:hypothetical protein